MSSPFQNHVRREQAVNCFKKIFRMGDNGLFVNGDKSSIPAEYPFAWEDIQSEIQEAIGVYGFNLTDMGNNQWKLTVFPA